MPFIDDNYLDGVLTRITKDHRDILMKTAKRLNLPDDDVLFLYIGAVESTVLPVESTGQVERLVGHRSGWVSRLRWPILMVAPSQPHFRRFMVR